MSDEQGMATNKELLIDEGSLDVIQDTLGEFLQSASVNAVYGEPIKDGDTLIIPSAEVLSLMGFGVGSGYGRGMPEKGEDSESNDGYTGEGGGGGGGGGGRILSRPAAVVIVSPEGVRVEPVVDKTKIALAALTAGGFVLGMLFRMMSPRKALKNM